MTESDIFIFSLFNSCIFAIDNFTDKQTHRATLISGIGN